MGWRGVVLALSCVALAGAAGEERTGPTLRVGLTVGEGPQFPELGRRFLVGAGPARETLRGPLTVRAKPPELAAQVGVFSQEKNARALMVRLQALGFAVERREENGQHRVWVLPRSTRGEVERGLKEAGLAASWVTRHPGSVEVVGGEGGVVQGEAVTVEPVDPLPVAVGKRRYRGNFVCVAGERGPVIVNLVPLEDYLLGVVPAEMGPKNFPSLEPLKAQAVAARSYALAQVGAHGAEGFDLCDQEHCQVYLGADAEDPLASRAVAETAGLVLAFQGRVVRAYFHSTCGGRTEAGPEVFPGEHAPYLSGVPCLGETVRLGRGGDRQPLDPRGRFAFLAQHLAGESRPRTPSEFARTLGQKARGRVEEALGLPDFAPLFGAGVSWGRILQLFRRVPPEAPVADPWQEVLLLAQLAGVVEVREGAVVPGGDGPHWRNLSTGEEVPVGQALTLWREDGRLWVGGGEALAGSRAWLWCSGLRCPVVEVEASASADARAPLRSWVREWSGPELGARLGVTGIKQIRVVRRTESGRAAAVEVSGGDGTKTLSGVAFRRVLSLPSAWFVVGQRGEGSGAVFRFYGKGWGHGVGLCQNGAYGLSLGGWNWERILAHYYPGTQVVRWPTAEQKGGS